MYSMFFLITVCIVLSSIPLVAVSDSGDLLEKFSWSRVSLKSPIFNYDVHVGINGFLRTDIIKNEKMYVSWKDS